jgi:hypothetical protein
MFSVTLEIDGAPNPGSMVTVNVVARALAPSEKCRAQRPVARDRSRASYRVGPPVQRACRDDPAGADPLDRCYCDRRRGEPIIYAASSCNRLL